MAIVYSFANDEHGGEGEVVLVNNLGEVLQLTAVYFLVGPREVIAGSHGGVLGIFHQEFFLHIVNDGCREEDAHGALTFGEQVQLFLFWHGCTALATSEDDGLRALRDGELALQLCRSSQERRDAWSDVIRHVVGVEESHLLLYGAEDMRQWSTISR